MREFPDYSVRSGFSGNSLGQEDRAETLGKPKADGVCRADQ